MFRHGRGGRFAFEADITEVCDADYRGKALTKMWLSLFVIDRKGRLIKYREVL